MHNEGNVRMEAYERDRIHVSMAGRLLIFWSCYGNYLDRYLIRNGIKFRSSEVTSRSSAYCNNIFERCSLSREHHADTA